jgi:SAM-dependent methyltransferase
MEWAGKLERRGEVERHYAELLAPVYVWMLGGAEVALARAKAWVAERGLARLAPGLAVDLGCGPGFHALALAEAGFETLAIDSSRELLAELEARRGQLPIRVFEGDLGEFEEQLGGAAPKLVLCLGDTLPHLPSERTALELIDACARSIAPEGVLALSFRDYSVERKPSECLIRVREEPERSFTCALEFEQERVRVTDILHEWRGGRWIESRSTYPKLRLAPERVREKLLARGFTLETDELAGGLATLIARLSGTADRGPMQRS